MTLVSIMTALSINEIMITPDQVVDAIYITEGGTHTKHPYGILTHYKHTTPHQGNDTLF